MTLRIICRWAGACGAVAAIAAFDAVVVRKSCVRFSVCEAGSEVHENRARLTLANCRGDTGYPVCVAVCLPAVWVSVRSSKKFPETGLQSKHVWRVATQYYRELR